MIQISWDDDKEALDDFLSADWDAMVTDQKTRAKVSNGAGTPTVTTTTPSMVGEIYVDTSALKIYIATGTSGPSDFKKVLSQ